MQTYAFSSHPNQPVMCIHKEVRAELEPEFIWLDCVREDVLHDVEQWQNAVFAATGLRINEYHLKDILNAEHPCAFETLDEYDL